MDSRYYQNLARSQWEASVSVENPMLREHLKSEARLNDLAAERAKTIESQRPNAQKQNSIPASIEELKPKGYTAQIDEIKPRDWAANPPVSDADVINYERQIGVPKGMRFEDMEKMSEEDYKKAEEKRRKWDEKQAKKIPKLSSDQKDLMKKTSKEMLQTDDPMQSLMDKMAADPLNMGNRKDPNANAGGAVKFFTDSDGKVRPIK